jgi:hypothetical protein
MTGIGAGIAPTGPPMIMTSGARSRLKVASATSAKAWKGTVVALSSPSQSRQLIYGLSAAKGCGVLN